MWTPAASTGTKKNSAIPEPGRSASETYAAEKNIEAWRPAEARIFSPFSRNEPSSVRVATVFIASREPAAPLSELQAA